MHTVQSTELLSVYTVYSECKVQSKEVLSVYTVYSECRVQSKEVLRVLGTGSPHSLQSTINTIDREQTVNKRKAGPPPAGNGAA